MWWGRNVDCCHLKDGVHKDDDQMIPGCRKFHDEWGKKGPTWMREKYEIDFELLADSLHSRWIRHGGGVPFVAD
jgi:hypothetical protein